MQLQEKPELEHDTYVVKKQNFISRQVAFIAHDSMFWIVSFLIFIKSVMFIWITGTNGAASIKIGAGFVDTQPMYMTYFAFAVGITAFSLLFKGRGHFRALLVTDIIATIFLVGNLIYFRGFNNYINFFIFSAAGEATSVTDVIVSLIKPVDILFLIDIVFLILYSFMNKKAFKGTKRNVFAFILVFAAVVGYLSLAHYKIDKKGRILANQEMFVKSFTPFETMSNLGPFGYIAFDGYNYRQTTKRYSLTEQDKADITQWYKDNDENLPDNQYAGVFKGKNLILIQVEALENFVINAKVGDEEVTPNLNKLLKNSLYFSNYHEQVANGNSSDSDYITNSGMYPLRDGITFYRYVNNSYPASLPNILGKQGYDSLSAHPSKRAYWNYEYNLTNLGYKNFKGAEDYNITEAFGLGISDKNYFQEVQKYIDKLKQPFLVQTVTMSSHTTFNYVPENQRTLKLTDNLNGTKTGEYLQAIHYADEQIGTFLKDLQQKGLLENTVVAIYGDHTGLHKYFPTEASKVQGVPSSFIDNGMRIPLIIYNKDQKGTNITTNGGQVDFLPTINYLFGTPKSNYINENMGRNLLNTKVDATILKDFTIVGKPTETQKKHLIDGMNLSQKIISSNYFATNK